MKHKGAWLSLLWILLLPAALFGLLPFVLALLPAKLLGAGVWLLLYPAGPVLSLLLPAWATRRGAVALLACVLPGAAYLLLLCHDIYPVIWVLLLCVVLGTVSASFGQEKHKRAQADMKKREL